MNEITHLIQQLENTPEQVRTLVTGLSAEQQVSKEGDEFSILESVCHLRDVEAEGYAVRIRRILDEDNPALADIDGSRLAIEREYQRQDLDQAVQSFISAREQNVSRLKSASSADLSRTGKLEGVGQVTLKRLLEMMIEHDEGHVDDLRRSRRVTGLV